MKQLPHPFANFPRTADVAIILYDFINKYYDGTIEESRLSYFYKKYPECRDIIRKYCLKDFCSLEKCCGLLEWQVTRDDVTFRGSIVCAQQYNATIALNIAKTKAKLLEMRKLEAMESFDMKLKYWLLVSCCNIYRIVLLV